MGLVAGIDIGNSTTEIVITSGSEPIAWDRRPTRGMKGSEASIKAAVSLLQSLQREHQLIIEKVVVKLRCSRRHIDIRDLMKSMLLCIKMQYNDIFLFYQLFLSVVVVFSIGQFLDLNTYFL